MIRLTALAVLLISGQAWACPDLAGTYICSYQDGSQETLTVTQSEQRGVVIYDYNGSRLVTDNSPYPLPSDANLRGATFRAWCDPAEGTPLRAQIVGPYYSQGSMYGELILDMTYARIGDDIKQTTQGVLRSSGGQSPLNSEQLCKRTSGRLLRGSVNR